MTQSAQIQEVLPNASIKDNSLSIFAHISKVTDTDLNQLLPLGLREIKRSGAGITLTFKMTN